MLDVNPAAEVIRTVEEKFVGVFLSRPSDSIRCRGVGSQKGPQRREDVGKRSIW